MAQQDDIIIIRTVESITTSILDYFLNVALVTPVEEADLVEGQSFDASGIEIFASLPAVAEKFVTTSQVYKIARDIFNQKSNNGVNQSNLRRFVVLKKELSDVTVEDCLNRLGYKNAYFMMVNQSSDADITSANNWVSGYRKILFAQTDSQDVPSSATNDIATALKMSNAGRTALYYHEDMEESLAGSIASILASYPIGGKTASYKKPTGITVDVLSDTAEGHLEDKNVNFYVPFIGGAGDYSTRYLTSANGVVSNGDEIEKIIAIDRTVLSLQAGLMDALEQDIPYDDNGGTIVYGRINRIFAELKREGIFAEDSTNDETGEVDKSYTIKVLPRATVKANYPDYFKQKMFIAECTINLAGSGKKVMITIAY